MALVAVKADTNKGPSTSKRPTIPRGMDGCRPCVSFSAPVSEQRGASHDKADDNETWLANHELEFFPRISPFAISRTSAVNVHADGFENRSGMISGKQWDRD